MRGVSLVILVALTATAGACLCGSHSTKLPAVNTSFAVGGPLKLAPRTFQAHSKNNSSILYPHLTFAGAGNASFEVLQNQQASAAPGCDALAGSSPLTPGQGEHQLQAPQPVLEVVIQNLIVGVRSLCWASLVVLVGYVASDLPGSLQA